MNYLELCKKLMQRAGISGAIASVQNQTGEIGRVVSWIDEAYRYVLNKHRDWEFLRRDTSFTTSGMQREYTAVAAGVAQFGEWRFHCEYGLWNWTCWAADLGHADEQPLVFMDYDAFRSMYQFGSAHDDVGRPQVITVKPDQSLLLWPSPSNETPYQIEGEHYWVPPDMTANADVPAFAERFHMAIVYRALMLYGEFEGDTAVFAVGQSELSRILSVMESVYLPSITIGRSMA